MSYATYTTEALVCGVFDRNTADRTYRLYTKEAGMLYAEAKSVREERSKQRYALQEFSHIRVSLVKGKQAWKIGSVETIQNHYATAINREARGSVVKIYKTLRRFIHGEEASRQLFTTCVRALEYVQSEVPARSFVDVYIYTQILQQLGYVRASDVPSELLGCTLEEIPSRATVALQTALEVCCEHAVEQSQL
jgi:DNA repair protein RecO